MDVKDCRIESMPPIPAPAAPSASQVPGFLSDLTKRRKTNNPTQPRMRVGDIIGIYDVDIHSQSFRDILPKIKDNWMAKVAVTPGDKNNEYRLVILLQDRSQKDQIKKKMCKEFTNVLRQIQGMSNCDCLWFTERNFSALCMTLLYLYDMKELLKLGWESWPGLSRNKQNSVVKAESRIQNIPSISLKPSARSLSQSAQLSSQEAQSSVAPDFNLNNL